MKLWIVFIKRILPLILAQTSNAFLVQNAYSFLKTVSQKRHTLVTATTVTTKTSTTTTCTAAVVSSKDNPAHITTSSSSGGGDAVQQVSLDDDKSSRRRNLEAYHLIWSPGAWKKMLVGSLSLLVVTNTRLGGSGWLSPHIVLSFQTTGWTFPVPLSFISNNLLLPLAASSCCLLQLGINLLAGGCAGFNTMLGPIRPYCLSLLLYLTLTSHTTRISMIFLRWFVALLPELLDVWNIYLEHQQQQMKVQSLDDKMVTACETSNNTLLQPLQATITLSIPTMGCVACINTIDSSLRQVASTTTFDKQQEQEQQQGVIQAISTTLNPFGIKGGQACIQVQVRNQYELDQLIQQLVQAVHVAGFEPCIVDSVKKK